MQTGCACLVCGCCAHDHGGWSHPWTGDVELLLTAAAEAVRQTWPDRVQPGTMEGRAVHTLGNLAGELSNERRK